MDILSHGLWAALYGKIAGRKLKHQLKFWPAFLWGIFPDLFAFTPHMLWSHVLRNGALPSTHLLYSMSHSIPAFLAIVLIYWLATHKIPWIMGGWLLHILMDIPTHTAAFYPTPFLWPLSDYRFSGIAWAQPWFIVANYLTIMAVFLYVKKTDHSNATAN